MRAKGNNYLGMLILKVRILLEPCPLLIHPTRLKSSQNFMKATIPAKYHHLAIPTYRSCFFFFAYATNIEHRLYVAIGCRRIIRDQGYLQSLNRPNVRLTFDHIARVEPDGVVTTTGIHLGFSLEAALNKARS